MSKTTVAIIVFAGTILCLAWLLIKSILLISNLARAREHRLPYIKSYKQGSFITNYLIMLLIFFVGILYREGNILTAFSHSITEAADFITLKLNTASISGLMGDSLLYSVAVYWGYFLIILGTGLLTLSIMQQYIWSAWKSFCAKITRKEMLYVLGYSNDNISICKSDGKRRYKYVVAKVDPEAAEKLYIQNLPYVSADAEEWVKKHLGEFVRRAPKAPRNALAGWIYQHITRLGKKKIVVINTGDDKKNVEICKLFSEAIASATSESQSEAFQTLRVLVFGDPEYQAIYQSLAERGMGCVSYINKYERIAMDFINQYPLTLFMDCQQIDYDTSLIKPGVDINVAFIGFGKTSRQILLSSVASNQFLTEQLPVDAEGKPIPGAEPQTVHKPIQYYVFDKEHSEQNKNLNHGYFRFRHKLKNIQLDDYLPMPSSPAVEEFVRMDINDERFYGKLKSIVTGGTHNANFIVISFGNDLENLDMAQKLVEKCREWDAKDVTIFVRAFHWRKEQTPLKDNNCYFFGDEEQSVFHIDKLLSGKIYEMAKMRSKAMDMERALTRADLNVNNEHYQTVSRTSEEELWHQKKTQIQRDSSVYACLGLRFKLNLMGLDYREKKAGAHAKAKDQADGVKVYNEKEYFDIYAKGDLPDTESIRLTVNGKKIVYYNGEYVESRRKNMAIQEHCRWVSFVISRGVVPATKHSIQTETNDENGEKKRTSGKNYKLRRHGNLTSYEGLQDFTRLIADSADSTANQRSEYEKDRYRFRYQILDDAYWLLDRNGFEIVSKISRRENSHCDKIEGCTECNKRKKEQAERESAAKD